MVHFERWYSEVMNLAADNRDPATLLAYCMVMMMVPALIDRRLVVQVLPAQKSFAKKLIDSPVDSRLVGPPALLLHCNHNTRR